MTKDAGVWTAGDCALVRIDCQNQMFEVIRAVALFLASDESSSVTGIDLMVDGGMKVW